MLGVRWPVISVTVSDLVRVDRPYAWRRYRLNCPRCGSTSTLVNTKYAGIAVDLCERCRGIWLDDHELSLLEAKAESTEDDREGTLIFAERVSDLECPVCNSGMRAFDYRASSLELNSCSDMHGYWLDAKESNKVVDLIEERVQDLKRSREAEEEWTSFLVRVKSRRPTISEFFRGLGL